MDRQIMEKSYLCVSQLMQGGKRKAAGQTKFPSLFYEKIF